MSRGSFLPLAGDSEAKAGEYGLSLNRQLNGAESRNDFHSWERAGGKGSGDHKGSRPLDSTKNCK